MQNKHGECVFQKRSNKGAAAVEFALVVPIIFLLLFSVVDFGRIYFVQISLEAASHEAVRASALNEITDHCISIDSPGNGEANCPSNTYLSQDIFSDVDFAAQKSASSAAAIATLGKNDEIEVNITRACSILYNLEFTEVTVSLNFDWLIPITNGAMENLTISAKGFMKCFR